MAWKTLGLGKRVQVSMLSCSFFQLPELWQPKHLNQESFFLAFCHVQVCSLTGKDSEQDLI